MNKQDIQNILLFLNRVDLKGTEATELARLQQLLVSIAQQQPTTRESTTPLSDDKPE